MNTRTQIQACTCLQHQLKDFLIKLVLELAIECVIEQPIENVIMVIMCACMQPCTGLLHMIYHVYNGKDAVDRLLMGAGRGL